MARLCRQAGRFMAKREVRHGPLKRLSNRMHAVRQRWPEEQYPGWTELVDLVDRWVFVHIHDAARVMTPSTKI
jgi:hypothetical protein